MSKKISRRKFITAGIGTAAVLGIGYLTKDYWLSNQKIQTELEEIPGNNPPYADFQIIKPKYILPAVGQEVHLISTSKDPDNDPLVNSLYINDELELETESDNLRFKFREPGTNRVRLEVSDGELTDEDSYNWSVEPDQIYPTKQLNLRYKGVRYFAGPVTPEWPNVPNPSIEVMKEQLETIHKDLGCNAISISSGPQSEDKMIECGKLAIEEGFELIFIQPSYVNATVDETIEKIGEFAFKVKSLREMSDAVTYMVGHEFQLETAIIRGRNHIERFQNSNNAIDLDKLEAVLPGMFRRIIAVCKKNYGYGISYAATPYTVYKNLIPWSDPIFESIGVNAYIHDFLGWDELWYFTLFSRLKKLGKPIYSTDWGMMSFAGADKWGGWNPLNIGQNPYDEEPQVRFTERTLDMYNQAEIDGCFWVQYNDNFDRGHGLYHPQTRKRKKGFYAYKSYEIEGQSNAENF